MLLRTLLLFLCVSSGLCATLSLVQMQAKDEDTPDLDNVAEALDGDTNTQETEATTDDTPKDPSSNAGLLEKLMANDLQQEANEEVDVPVVPSEETATDTDNKTEDVPIVEAPINDQPPQDVPVVEIKATEAPIQDQPPQEEDNEIKPIPTEEAPKKPEESRWSLNSIRNSFQNMHGYFDSLVELVGGRNGECTYRCRYGDLPVPRPGYQLPEPNGCSSSLVGFQLDLGIPAMTQCCNQLDSCYDTCGTSKYDCDASFRSCLHDICADLKKSLGIGTQVQTCESMADGLFNTVWTLGCRPYMNSQRAACICHEEEKDEL